MSSLENLTNPLSIFDITDEQKQEIQKHMTRCDSCRKWKYNRDLSHGKCEPCRGIKKPKRGSSSHSKKSSGANTPKKSKKTKEKAPSTSDALTAKAEKAFMRKLKKENVDIYYQTIYLTIKDYLMRGMQLTQAIECAGMKQSEYNKVPRVYKDRLMALKKAKTAQMRNY